MKREQVLEIVKSKVANTIKEEHAIIHEACSMTIVIKNIKLQFWYNDLDWELSGYIFLPKKVNFFLLLDSLCGNKEKNINIVCSTAQYLDMIFEKYMDTFEKNIDSILSCDDHIMELIKQLENEYALSVLAMKEKELSLRIGTMIQHKNYREALRLYSQRNKLTQKDIKKISLMKRLLKKEQK